MKKQSPSQPSEKPQNRTADAESTFRYLTRVGRVFNRRLLLMLIDAFCFVLFAVFMATTLFWNKGTPDAYRNFIISYAVFFVCIFASRFLFRTYRTVWRYTDPKAFLKVATADFCGAVVAVVATYPLRKYTSWVDCFLFMMAFDLCTILLRVGYQYLTKSGRLHRGKHHGLNKIGVAIVGAGQTGAALANELLSNEDSHYRPICFIDKDAGKVYKSIYGCKVYPACRATVDRIKHMPVQEIFIALPGLDSETAKELHDLYITTGCKVKLYDFPMKEDTVEGAKNDKRIIREIRIEDLLFRRELKINTAAVKSFYTDKIVLVTGGGGSIGSELCRQIAKRHPKKLIILDIYENNAYAIQQELIRKYGDALDLSVEIASVRDRTRLNAIFDYYRPEIVFHAAAHKHVPLMEHSGCEAIKNNVFGTHNTADMAEKYGVQKFILVSTDKAVNPTNIMGASKRMCEMVVQCRTDSQTSFAAVRFGNVLGSNGSVIPLFKEQIANGGPITITDKRIIRYFMTIPEASQLVMQAGALAERGELFVLDMGKPIRILDLAENMIRLAGYRPYRDIDIVEVGLRPGEKLYEELLIRTEELLQTDNELIFIEKDAPLTRHEVDEKLAILRKAVEDAAENIESPIIRDAMMQTVPTYHLPEEVNRTAKKSTEMKMAASVG